MKTFTNGWHMVAGHYVYLKNNNVTKAVRNDSNLEGSVYRKKNYMWSKENDISAEAFDAGCRRGTITVF